MHRNKIHEKMIKKNKSGQIYMSKIDEITNVVNENEIMDIIDHKEIDNQMYFLLVLNIQNDYVRGWIKGHLLQKFNFKL
jgi:disulfide oxidoreductase YuzD